MKISVTTVFPIAALLFLCPATVLLSQVQWSALPTVPTSSADYLVVSADNTLLVGDREHILASTNAGSTWFESSAGYHNVEKSPVIAGAASPDGYIYLSMRADVNDSSNVLFRSSDNGKSWNRVVFSGGAPKAQLEQIYCRDDNSVIAMLHFGYSYDFQGGTYELVVSTDHGATFQAIPSPPDSRKLLMQDNTPYVIDKMGFIHTFDEQHKSWNVFFTPEIHQVSGTTSVMPSGMTVTPLKEYVVWGGRRLYASQDSGATWDTIATVPYPVTNVHALGPDSLLVLFTPPTFTKYFASTVVWRSGGVWKTQPGGTVHYGRCRSSIMDQNGVIYASDNIQFTRVIRYDRPSGTWLGTSLSNAPIADLVPQTVKGIMLFKRDGSVLFSDNGGLEWSARHDTLTGRRSELVLYSGAKRLGDGHIYMHTDGFATRSTDNGNSWTRLTEIIRDSVDLVFFDKAALYTVKDSVIREFDIYQQKYTRTLDVPRFDGLPQRIFHVSNGNYLYGTSHYSSDGGNSFIEIPRDKQRPGFSIRGMVETSPGVVVVGVDDPYDREERLGMTTDGGRSWVNIPLAVPMGSLSFLEEYNGVAYTYDTYNGLARFSPNFDNVTFLGLKAMWIWNIAVDSEGVLYAIAEDGKVYKGSLVSNWEQTNKMFMQDANIVSMATRSNDELWAVSQNAGAARTLDNGNTWNYRTLQTGVSVFRTHVDHQDKVRVGTSVGVYEYINTWQRLADFPIGNFVYDIAESGEGKLYATVFGQGVYASGNGGANWEYMNDGMTNLYVRSITVNTAGEVFAITNGGIFRAAGYLAPWNNISANLGNIISGSLIRTAFGSMIYANTDQGFYSSLQASIDWKAELPGVAVFDLLSAQNGELFAATDNGIYRKTHAAGVWENIDFGGNTVRALAENSGYYFASIEQDRVYRIPKWILTDVAGPAPATGEPIIYPNPVNDFFTIRAAGVTDVLVLDILGNVLLRQTINGLSIIPTANWPAGTYIVRCGAKSTLIIKQ